MQPMASDHFSTQSAAYARHRPRYPADWFDWLAEQVPHRGHAWDCACGSGQATADLALRFERVTATDASAEQIRHAPTVSNVEWRVAHAEESGLPDGCADLVTVAQALHWFDLPRFWEEARRVLRPGAVVAAWSYATFSLPSAALQEVCDDFYTNIVGDFWPPERLIVEAGYGTLVFPFEEMTPPPCEMVQCWSLEELLGYLSSWSATARCTQARGGSPIPDLRDRLAPHWPRGEERLCVRWPLSMRVGRKTR